MRSRSRYCEITLEEHDVIGHVRKPVEITISSCLLHIGLPVGFSAVDKYPHGAQFYFFASPSPLVHSAFIPSSSRIKAFQYGLHLLCCFRRTRLCCISLRPTAQYYLRHWTSSSSPRCWTNVCFKSVIKYIWALIHTDCRSLSTTAQSLAGSPSGQALLFQLSQGQKTLFAPTNAAFAGVPSNITSNSTLVESILTYHLLSGSFPGSSIATCT